MQRVVQVYLMEARSLIMSTQWEKIGRGQGGTIKVHRKGWTSGADADCRLQTSCSFSWNVGLKTVLGSLQTFCSLSWSAINSPRDQKETWRRR